jgi:FkbM family methyltransferase
VPALKVQRSLSRWSRAGARRSLQVLPPALLRPLGARPGRLGRAARAGLRSRLDVIAGGPAAGLCIDPGGTNPAVALGTYETPVQHRLAAMLDSGSVFYDVGANIGFYTVLGARLVGDGGAVYAFEPVPDNAAVLRRNVAANQSPNVRLVTRAASSTTASERLLLTPYAGGHFLASTMPEAPTVATVGELHVETVTIDDFVASAGVRPPDVV